jgi:lysyl-tRNA synthetase class 2
MDSIGRYEVNISSNDTPELISLKPPYARISMIDLVKNVVGEEMHPSMDIVRARDIAKANGVEPKDFWGAGKIIGEIYDEVAERTLTEPTFVMDHPVEISPLSKVHRDDPYLTERFELVIARRELVNAFSELNDPIDQRERFEAGQKAKDSGDIEATGVDEEYLRALEYGLPPTGGLGIGIDRLIMLLAETSTIRDVVLFPTLRPEN